MTVMSMTSLQRARRSADDSACKDLRLLWRQDANGISRPDHSAPENTGEDAFPGHHTVAHLMKNGAPAVTLLADLGDLEKDSLPKTKPCTRYQLPQPDAGGCDIFGKIPRIHRKSSLADFRDALHGEQAHLPVPVPCMGISVETATCKKPALLYIALLLAFALAEGDGINTTGWRFCHNC